MKEIKFNNQEYSIPENWNQVTIRQQILAESLSNTQTYIKSLGVIAAYTSIPIDELKKTETKDLLQVMSLLSFIDKPLSKEPIFEFEYKGDKYNVAESLLSQDFQDWVATQTAIAEYKEDNWKQLVYLLAIMAKRENESLDNFDVNERAEYFMDIDVETCQRVAAFFLSNHQISNLYSMLTSPEVQQEILINKIKDLQHTLIKLRKQRGGGLLTRLWIGVIRMYIRFSIRQLEKYFNISLSKDLGMNCTTTWRKSLWKKLRRKTKNS